MRCISLIIFFILPFFVNSAPAADPQVRVNGRIASFESVINYCGGDTAAALSVCEPLPVNSPYYTRARVCVEKFYNFINPAWLCVVVALLCAILPSNIYLSLLLVIFLVGEYAIRWWLGDTIPLVSVTDMAASIAVILGFVALANSNVHRLLSLVVVILMSCTALWGEHPAVRGVNPALLSSWLPFHVALMVIAYSLFLISAVAALAGKTGRRVFLCVIGGEISLAVGILIGSLWAHEAWGGYWSWDPKETAASVTFLVYLALIFFWRKSHVRANLLRIMVIAAFVAVLFTWIGVSGGLHSY